MLSKQSTGSSMHWVPKSEENRREEKDLRRGDSCDSTIENKTKKQLSTRLLEKSPEVGDPAKTFLKSKFQLHNFFQSHP